MPFVVWLRTACRLRIAEYWLQAFHDLAESRQRTSEFRRSLEQQGYDSTSINALLQATTIFDDEIAQDIGAYEKSRRREFGTYAFNNIGRMLISLRIGAGISQRELASRLGVDESTVSRDERNEYRGITVDRAQRVLDAVGATAAISVSLQPSTNITQLESVLGSGNAE